MEQEVPAAKLEAGLQCYFTLAKSHLKNLSDGMKSLSI